MGELREAVSTLLGDVRSAGAGNTVQAMEVMPAGASRQTWRIRTDADQLVLRLNTPGSPDGAALVREAALMTAAREAGVPGPRVVASGVGPGPLAAGYVLMEYVAGESLPRRILRDPALAGVRDDLAHQLGRILADLHRLDPASVDLPEEDPLAAWQAVLDRQPGAHPILAWGARWLRDHRPPPSGPMTCVHGDFRLGNLLLAPSGITAVLDWELAHRGDPLEDLGWLTIRAWRFGGPGEVAGVGSVEELIAGYVENGGRRVGLQELHWWQVLNTFRWGVICLHQGARHANDPTRAVELAAIGRRVCEPEYDLLGLLDGPPC